MVIQHSVLPPPVLVQSTKVLASGANSDLNSILTVSGGSAEIFSAGIQNIFDKRGGNLTKLLDPIIGNQAVEESDLIPNCTNHKNIDSEASGEDYATSSRDRKDAKINEVIALLKRWKHTLAYFQIPPNLHDFSAVEDNPNQKIYAASSHAGKDMRFGRRRRHYAEIWQEEDYLESLNESNSDLVDGWPLSDWSQLLPNNNENHDAYYRDWLVQTCGKRAAAIASSKAFKKRRKGDPKMRESGAFYEDEQQEIVRLAPPPVAPTAQHPASWGIGSRVTSGHVDFSIIHPACASSTVVLPPGKYIKENSLRLLAANKSEEIEGEEEEEDVDIFNICADVVQERLTEQELSNSIRLLRLQHFLEMDRRIRLVRDQRKQAEGLLTTIQTANAPKNSGREVYRMKPPLRINGKSSLLSEGTDNNSLNGVSPHVHGFSEKKFATRSLSHGFLGALVCSQVKHGCSLRTVKAGCVLEGRVQGTDGSSKWLPAVVVAVKQDGYIARHFKVIESVSPILKDACGNQIVFLFK